jgi:hypothetical protein
MVLRARPGYPVRDRLHGREPEFPRVFPGKWSGVSLPAGEQQVLDRIEGDLEGREPRLRSMFAIFTRLTRDEGAPRTESLGPGHFWWTWPHRGKARAIIAVPIVLGLVALLVFAAISSSVTHGCRSIAAPHSAASAVRTQSCQSAGEPHVRP